MRYLHLVVITIIISQSNCFALDAFPGAAGYGKSTVGGRGGTVYIVDTLSDDPADGVTFREAIEASGPRYITFSVSGLIELDSTLFLTNPYVTIAGETSPGGVMVTGHTFKIASHDIIMRHMRIRVGTKNAATCAVAESLDSLGIYGREWEDIPSYNIIIDHCSIGWGIDETFSITGGVNGITVSSSIIAEGLRGNLGGGLGCDGTNYLHPDGEHSKGLMFSGKYRYDQAGTFYRNFLAHNVDRNPLLYAESLYNSAGAPITNGNTQYVDGANNVAYNADGNLYTTIEGHLLVNWYDNYVKAGYNTDHKWSSSTRTYSDFPRVVYELNFYNKTDGWSAGLGGEEPLLYSYNNIGVGSTGGSDWRVSWYYYSSETNSQLISSDPVTYYLQDTNAWKSTTKFSFPDLTTDAGTADEFTAVYSALPASTMTESLAQEIVEDAGATKPSRDSVDTRLVNDFINTTGAIRDTVIYPDDYPTFAQTSPPTDSDSDGMADSWEVAEFGDLTQTATGDYNSDGYDNIEEYFHSLAGGSYIPPSSGTRHPWSGFGLGAGKALNWISN